jgi:beta-galactosidase
MKSLLVLLTLCTALTLPAAPAPTQAYYHGAAYYPELWPESNVDHDIQQMKALGINVVRMGEFAWSTMEPDEGRISLDFFLRVMDKLNAAGIKTVFCTPTATPPIWLMSGHPERCFVDQAGEVMSVGARQEASYDNPDVRAACFRIVEAVAEKIGRHPGLVAWQIDNELKCHVKEDYSDSSVIRWHEWLARRYGTIERLNAAWGTEIWSERYQRFDQVPAPRKTPFVHNASLTSAYAECSCELIADFMDAQSAILRRHSSAPITHNMNLGFGLNFERMCRNLDFAAFDDYPAAGDYERMLLDCDLFRAAKPDRPFWVMETSTAHNGWLADFQPAHPDGFLAAEVMACYGLGSETVSYWLWRQQRTGAELPHSAILSAWDQPEIGYASVQQVERARQRFEPLIRGTRPAPAEAALTWSDRARIFMQIEPIGGNSTHKVDYREDLGAWHKLLLDAGIPRDLRFEGSSLAGLKLLVTPDMPCVDAAFLARVTAWVEAGGTWICGPLTGMRTAEHTVPTDAALGPVEALGGVETVFSFPMTGTRAFGTAWGRSAPLSGWCNAFRPVDAATQVVGLIAGDHAAGLAFLTDRAVGRGRVVMLGALPEGAAGSALLAELVDHYARLAQVSQRHVSTPGTLICPRLDAAARASWLVVNLDGRGGVVQLPAAARDVVTGQSVPAGPLAVGAFECRGLQF